VAAGFQENGSGSAGRPGAPGPDVPPVPAGFRLHPDPGLATYRDGTVLLGGSPYRLMRLGPKGAAHVRAWCQGEPVRGSTAARALARRLLAAGMAHPRPEGGPSPRDVTVVIPVRDRAAELARCLAGLAGHPGRHAGPSHDGHLTPHSGPAQHGGASQRVIVVDDGSDCPRAVAEAATAAGAQYLRRERNGGPAAARNTGLAAAATPLVAFVDSDCVPEPGWLDPLLPHFADPAVAAAAPRIVPHERGPGWLARYEGVSSTLDMGPAESLVRPGTRVPYVPGAAIVVRKAAAGDGFAEDMPVGEDVDFVWRLAAAGWHVRYEPRAAMAHEHRVRFGRWFARRADYGTSAAALELRHPGTVPAVSMSGWSALAWLAAAAGHPEAGAAVTGTAAALLARRLDPFTDDPWPLAARLAGGGTFAAGRLLGSALSRAWWPVALPAAVASRRLRLPLAALVLAPPLLGWRERRPPMDPARYAAARLLDDVAYSIGVWKGCLEHRTARPLLPALWWRSSTAELGGPAPGQPR
jgi:mycofactocin glycosyltransferase